MGINTSLVHRQADERLLKRGMSPLAIVKGFDVLKSGTSGLCACLKGLSFNTFPFETMEETLHRCMIVAVGVPTHTGYHAFLPQEGLIALTAVGAATITVRKSSRLLGGDEQ